MSQQTMTIGGYVITRKEDGGIVIYCKMTNLSFKFDTFGAPTQGSPAKRLIAMAKAFAKANR